jgi:hypothetical protein
VWARHVETKAVFLLHELKEWGMLVIEYVPGDKMSADLLMKNLPGYEVISDATVHQARESAKIGINAMLGNGVCNSPVSKCTSQHRTSMNAGTCCLLATMIVAMWV